MALIRREIGDLLVDNGVISQDELDLVRQEHEKSGETVAAVLSRLGLATENHLKNALELEYGVNYVSLQKREPDQEVLTLIPEEVIRRHQVIPLSQQGNRLTVAMVDPSDSSALDEIKTHLNGLQVKPVVCLEDDFNKFLDVAFPPPEPEPVPEEKKEPEPEPEAKKEPEPEPEAKKEPEAPAKAPEIKPQPKIADKTEAIELPQEETPAVNQTLIPSTAEHSAVAPPGDQLGEAELIARAKEEAIVLLANQILGSAIKRHCSNIHIQATAKQVIVHYRLNGVLYVDRKLPKTLLLPLVTRYKMMARMNVTERRLPQDGHIKVKSSAKEIVCLVSCIPGEHGETVAIWIV